MLGCKVIPAYGGDFFDVNTQRCIMRIEKVYKVGESMFWTLEDATISKRTDELIEVAYVLVSMIDGKRKFFKLTELTTTQTGQLI